MRPTLEEAVTVMSFGKPVLLIYIITNRHKHLHLIISAEGFKFSGLSSHSLTAIKLSMDNHKNLYFIIIKKRTFVNSFIIIILFSAKLMEIHF